MPPTKPKLTRFIDVKSWASIRIEKKKHIGIAVGVVGAMVLVVVAILHRSHHHLEAVRKYSVTSVWRTNEDITQQYVGQIRAIQHIELRALEHGYLNEIFVDEGQKIEKGQRMFRIMPLINEAEFKKASAEADLAKIEYDNTAVLARRKVVSKNELALAKAKFENVIYPGLGHVYTPEMWEKMEAWFGKWVREEKR